MKKNKLLKVLLALGLFSLTLTSCGQGPQGEIGPQGEQGLPGEKGDKGDTGEQGPKGDKGDKGDQGDKGDKGDTGDKGDKGDTGATGPQGPQGEQGAAGQNGEDGASVLTGYGAPSADLGKVGDSYINLSNWDYYLKGEEGWEKMGNLKGEKGQDATTYIPCIFYNYDGSKLFEFYYEKGSDIVYNGPTPTRESDYNGEEELPWTFIGWDKSLENIQEPTIFTAQYKGKDYGVTFLNYDGTLLDAGLVEIYHDAVYSGETPVKEGEGGVEWTFVGWDNPLTNITSDTVFTAQFTTENGVQVTFKDYNDVILQTKYIVRGEDAVYTGVVPTRNDVIGAGQIVRYTFNGWNKPLTNITEDTVFTAQYLTTSYYQVRFLSDDSEVLYSTYVENGDDMPTYPYDEPTKEDVLEGGSLTRYTFTGWSGPDIIVEPTDYVATFSSETFSSFPVRFYDREDNLLYTDATPVAQNASYDSDSNPYVDLFSYDGSNVYIFKGWDNSLENVREPRDVHAQYIVIPRSEAGQYPTTKAPDSALPMLRGRSLDANNCCTLLGDKFLKIDDDTFYKFEPINWTYLGEENGKALVTSSHIIDYVKWDNDGGSNYANSSIRNYLNGGFISLAFNSTASLNIAAVDNSAYSTGIEDNPYACDDTNDRVFLLSIMDYVNANYRYVEANDRRAVCTEYVNDLGLSSNKYWTRSPLSDSKIRTVSYGSISSTFASASSNLMGIRPALYFTIA